MLGWTYVQLPVVRSSAASGPFGLVGLVTSAGGYAADVPARGPVGGTSPVARRGADRHRGQRVELLINPPTASATGDAMGVDRSAWLELLGAGSSPTSATRPHRDRQPSPSADRHGAHRDHGVHRDRGAAPRRISALTPAPGKATAPAYGHDRPREGCPYEMVKLSAAAAGPGRERRRGAWPRGRRRGGRRGR